jgi:hypothetical protein
MEVIQKNISNFIENQFPSIYREEGQIFIEFVKEYYKWLETQGPVYYSRNFFEFKDLDETTEQFLIYFKEKYLKNIQFETTTNTRQLLKHTLDLYRSKGTDRAIDLLFKLVFGVLAEVYYPAEDLFSLSSGVWKKQKYLELNISKENAKLSGKSITGQASGAIAYVDAVVRKRIKGRLIDIAYISSLNGDFQTDEAINTEDNILHNGKKPYIIGSLNEVFVSTFGVGAGYEIGDIVELNSLYGTGAKARVSNVATTIGTVQFELTNGGYAYSANAEVLISDKVITLSNVVTSNAATNNYFEIFNSVVQPLANINFLNATGIFTPDEYIYTYHPNNAVRGVGKVISTSTNTATNGQIFIIKYSGNLQSNAFYTTGNSISANQSVSNGYADRTATANVIGVSSNITVYTINSNNTFLANNIVYQVEPVSNVVIANGTILKYTTTVGSNGVLTLANTHGVFRRNLPIYSNNLVANVDSVELQIGIIDPTFTYSIYSNNYFYSNAENYNTTAVVKYVSTGSGASFAVSNDLIYTEYVNINTDLISEVSSNALSGVYAFDGFPTANLSTVIGNVLSFSNTQIGKIHALTSFNPGSNYSTPPFVLVYEPKTYRYLKQDAILTIANVTSSYAIGELITQDSNDSRGIVKFANSTTLIVERLRLNDSNNFIITTNNTTRLYGETGGSYANVTNVQVQSTSDYLGFNAVIFDETQTSVGAINELQILDSGYGFTKNDIVSITSANNDSLAEGKAILSTHGEASGFYKQNDGFLSDTKKLFDGIYYQDYSYEIQSSVKLNKYEEMLKQVLHLAGTKYFARFIYSDVLNAQVNILDTDITVE